MVIKTMNDDQDVQVEDSSEESDGPYLNTIVHYPCRVISSLHCCHTVPYLITIVRYSCRPCCYLHSCYTGPYIITIVHHPCMVSYSLHSCYTAPDLITDIHYRCKVTTGSNPAIQDHILLLLFNTHVGSATTSIPAVPYIILFAFVDSKFAIAILI